MSEVIDGRIKPPMTNDEMREEFDKRYRKINKLQAQLKLLSLQNTRYRAALEVFMDDEHNIMFISAEYQPGTVPIHKDQFDDRCSLCKKLKQIEEILK